MLYWEEDKDYKNKGRSFLCLQLKACVCVYIHVQLDNTYLIINHLTLLCIHLQELLSPTRAACDIIVSQERFNGFQVLIPQLLVYFVSN